eukprot:g3949.t1
METAERLQTQALGLRGKVARMRKDKNLPCTDEADFESPECHAHRQLQSAVQKIDGDKTFPDKTSIQQRRLLKGHYGKVYAMHWAGDSRRLVSASQDGKLIIWDGLTTNKLSAVPLRSSWVMTCAFDQSSPSSRTVACGGLDNICSIFVVDDTWTPERGPNAELSGHDGYLSCCRFVNNKQILTASGDHNCMLFDIPKRKPISTFCGHTSDVMSIAVNPNDPNQFVSGSCDTQAKVWDKRQPHSPVLEFWGHEADINCVEYCKDGFTFVSGSDDASVRMWDIRSSRELAKFNDEGVIHGITSLAVSNSGKIIFAGQDDYNCMMWNTLDSTKEPIRLGGTSALMHTHENRLSTVGISPDGNALCTGSWDTVLKIWA